MSERYQKSRDELAGQLRFLRNLENKESFVDDFLEGRIDLVDVFRWSEKITEEYIDSLWEGSELDIETRKKIEEFRKDVIVTLLALKNLGGEESLASRFLSHKKLKDEYIESLWKHRKLDAETQRRLLELESNGTRDTDLIIRHIDNFDKEILSREILIKLILKRVRDIFWENFYYAAWYDDMDDELAECDDAEVDYNDLAREMDEGEWFINRSAEDLKDYFMREFEITDEDAKDIISKFINRFCRLRDRKKYEGSWNFYVDYQWSKYWAEKTSNSFAKKRFKELQQEVDDR